jgi:hypothetical protein
MVDRKLNTDPILRLTYIDNNGSEQQMKEFSITVLHHPYLQILSLPQDSRYVFDYHY